MTQSAIAYTALPGSTEAGRSLGEQIAKGLPGGSPDALILFASSRYRYAELLRALHAACRPQLLVGCSSAGEFISGAQGEGSACAVGLRSPELRFSAGIGRGLRADRASVAQELAASFRGLATHDGAFRSALVLTDALAGHADDLVEQLTRLTAGRYQFVGGGAGDDALFRRTHVFYGTEAVPDAAVALEILSDKPLGIGVRHGWQEATPGMRVTEADGMRLISLDAVPVVEVLQEYAERSGQHFDTANPLPFFLHNVIGIDTGSGHALRVPLAVHADGSISCAADIPTGALAHIMCASTPSAVEAATSATRDAVRQLGGLRPKVALVFDCVATRLRLGQEFGFELGAIQGILGPAQCVGSNTYGQIARAPGQFSGFHNCTAVVFVIPD